MYEQILMFLYFSLYNFKHQKGIINRIILLKILITEEPLTSSQIMHKK